MEIHLSPYTCIDGEGLENIAFKKQSSWFFVVPFVVPYKILPSYIALYDKQRVLRRT